MSENGSIYNYLVDKEIDYVNCSIDILMACTEEYFILLQDETLFSDQMLSFYESVKENRNDLDAIRLNMQALELLSPEPVIETTEPESKSDN